MVFLTQKIVLYIIFYIIFLSYERRVLYMTQQQGGHRKATLRDIAQATGFSINCLGGGVGRCKRP